MIRRCLCGYYPTERERELSSPSPPPALSAMAHPAPIMSSDSNNRSRSSRRPLQCKIATTSNIRSAGGARGTLLSPHQHLLRLPNNRTETTGHRRGRRLLHRLLSIQKTGVADTRARRLLRPRKVSNSSSKVRRSRSLSRTSCTRTLHLLRGTTASASNSPTTSSAPVNGNGHGAGEGATGYGRTGSAYGGTQERDRR